MAAKKGTHPEFAARIVKALPAALRNEAEVKSDEGKPYSIIKVRGKSLASVRDNAVRVMHAHGSTADDAKRFAAMLAESAPDEKPEPKPKPAKKAAPKKEAKLSAEQEAERAVEAANEADAEAAASAEGKADDADAK